MSFHIYELQLPREIKDVFTTDPGDQRLRRLSRLNVFIGPNNAGKSRMLRTIFAQQHVHFTATSGEATALRNSIDEIEACDLPKHIHAKVGRLHALLQLPLQDENGQRVGPQDRKDINAAVAETLQRHGIRIKEHSDKLGINIREKMEQTGSDLEALYRTEPAKRPFRKVYIPTLRGLRTPENDVFFYRRRTFNDYFQDYSHMEGENKEEHDLRETKIFTGLEIFQELQNYLLGTLEQREQVREFERHLSKTFFGDRPVSLIPRKKETALHVKIGDETEQPVWRLGDGIQQTIILTLPLFLHSGDNMLMFVEEPELFLHPGFQRVWIETVLASKSSLQVFVATHSHQFMDITVDSTRCSIYKFRGGLAEGEGRERDARHHVTFTSNSDFSVLRELGVRNSSVLLSNCTIWVEGITDRLYLRKYLDIFQADEGLNPSGRVFTEDLHFSFVEYGGSTITHFSFLDDEKGIDVERLCGELYLIADRDVGKEPRHKKLKIALTDRCHILDCIEIENLLTPEVLSAVVQGYEGEDAELHDVQQNDYKDIRLGKFIEEKLLTKKSNRKSDHPYQDASGTIKDKPGFCSRAIREIQSTSQMSEQAILLTKAIHGHILKHNA